MRARRPLQIRHLVAWSLVATLGCATGEATSSGGGPVPRRVVLAPVSFNQEVPELFEPGLPVLQAEIARYLTSKHCQVREAPSEEFLDLWRASAGAVGSLYGAGGEFKPEKYDAVIRAVLGELKGREEPFDALVLPYLAVRDAPIGRLTARWDGVQRKVRLVWPSRSAKARFPANASFGVSGAIKATSLHVMIYSIAGEKVVDHYGGLELTTEFLMRYGFSDESSSKIPNYIGWSYSYDPRNREDLFTNREELREGIQIAFGPYFRK